LISKLRIISYPNPGFNKCFEKYVNLCFAGRTSFPKDIGNRMSNFNLQYIPKTYKNFYADMAGNAWDGFLWVDGWPVTPPRMQQPPPVPDPAPQPQPPQPQPQPVPAPPPPMQPPSQHQPAQPVQPIHNAGNQVNLAQVESKTDDGDQSSNYTGTS
jgi:hypothetical protein